MAEETMTHSSADKTPVKPLVVDAEIPQLPPGPWGTVLKFQREPWEPTEQEWSIVECRVGRCEDCDCWHPLPAYSIATLKLLVTRTPKPTTRWTKEEAEVPMVAPFAYWVAAPRERFNKPW